VELKPFQKTSWRQITLDVEQQQRRGGIYFVAVNMAVAYMTEALQQPAAFTQKEIIIYDRLNCYVFSS
jgi:hypothetical protein